MRTTPVPAEPSRLPRFWVIRRYWPRNSELMRAADRIEKFVLGLVLIAAMGSLPVALAIGSETYAHGTQLAQQQGAQRHQALAVLSEAAPPLAPTTHTGVIAQTSMVTASWQLPDGTVRSGKVAATNGSPSGTRLAVWLDRAGNLVRPPLTRAGAVVAGVVVAVGLWGAGLAALAGLYLLTRLGLDRHRLAAWQRQWTAIEPDWTHPPS